MRGALVAILAAGVVAGTAVTEASAKSPAPSARYQRQLQVPLQNVVASLATIGEVTARSLRYPIPPTASRDAAASLESVQHKLRIATRGLASLKPPPAVAKQHALLLRGTRLLRSDLTPLIAKLRVGRYTLVATLSSLRGVNDLVTAVKQLRQHGYRVATASPNKG